MHTSPRRTISLLTIALGAGFLVAPVLAQTAKPNPLRNASYGHAITSSAKLFDGVRFCHQAEAGSDHTDGAATCQPYPARVSPTARARHSRRLPCVSIAYSRPSQPLIRPSLVATLLKPFKARSITRAMSKAVSCRKTAAAERVCSECFAIPCPRILLRQSRSAGRRSRFYRASQSG